MPSDQDRPSPQHPPDPAAQGADSARAAEAQDILREAVAPRNALLFTDNGPCCRWCRMILQCVSHPDGFLIYACRYERCVRVRALAHLKAEPVPMLYCEVEVQFDQDRALGGEEFERASTEDAKERLLGLLARDGMRAVKTRETEWEPHEGKDRHGRPAKGRMRRHEADAVFL